MKEFEVFKKEFTKYQNLFGLNGYSIYFEESDCDGDNGDIAYTEDNVGVTVRFNSSHHKERPCKLIAKHEAIHLLLWDLTRHAMKRYTDRSEIDRANEMTAFKLEKLIP